MRELPFLINDVRDATDNRDINGVKDREIIRYFQDAVRSVQTIIFKNNPLCSYFQRPVEFSSPVAGKVFDLPSETWADNAVSFVEVNSEASLDDQWSPLGRCFQEDQNSFLGWYTRNKTIVFTGYVNVPIGRRARAWYFYRLPRWDKVWATVDSVVGQVLTITVKDEDFSRVDNHICILSSAGVVKASGLKFTVSSPTTITVVGDLSTVVPGDQILMGTNSRLTVDLPEEVESYILSYVTKKVFGRNNYSSDAQKIDYFTEDDKANIISIFADVGQVQLRTPITDTDYLNI